MAENNSTSPSLFIIPIAKVCVNLKDALLLLLHVQFNFMVQHRELGGGQITVNIKPLMISSTKNPNIPTNVRREKWVQLITFTTLMTISIGYGSRMKG